MLTKTVAAMIWTDLPALNKQFEYEDVQKQLKTAAQHVIGHVEQSLQNEYGRRVRDEGVCPACGQDA